MRSHRNFAAIHVVGNALLLLLGYYWLGVGESRALTLIWSAVTALVFLILTLWLHGAAFVYFSGKPPELHGVFRRTLQNLAPIVAAAMALLAIYILLSLWAIYSAKPAFDIASWLTLKLRKPVKPATVLRFFNTALWVVRWVVVPVLALPVVARVATVGWQGFREFRSQRLGRLYWLVVPVLLLAAFWLPFRLVDWVPNVGTFALQMMSMIVRLTAGYLLFVASWLALAFVTCGGSPALSHSKAAAKP